MAGPLDGIAVLDFSSGMAGGLASLVLADFGAHVIKVEPPSGDPYRAHPAWVAWNRGKKSAVIDLESPAGVEQAKQLTRRADVLIESSQPGYMRERGLDYAALSELNPMLVYTSVTGWGQNGPLAGLPAYEGAVAAKTGRMQSYEGMLQRKGPAFAAVQVGTWAASQAAARGILAALRERDRRGHGQWVQTSLVQGMIPYENKLMNRGFQRAGGPTMTMTLGPQPTLQYIPVRTKDGHWLQHANLMNNLFHSFLNAIGLGWTLDDERFKTAPTLSDENREALRDLILEKMQEKTLDEWMAIYIADGNVAAEPYTYATDGIHHEQFLYNKHLIELDDPRVGKFQTYGLLATMSETPGETGGPAPLLGADTAEVLARTRDSSLVRQAPAGGGTDTKKAILDGVTVLDFSTVMAGPFGAAMIGEMGARVIKVDATPEREHRVMAHTAPNPIGNLKTYGGKECIQVDLQTDEGKRIVHQLIEQADVLLHNFRPGVPARLGIDWETCQAINPRLIHMYIGAYGPSGPHSRRPGAHPLPGARFGGALRQAGAAMPPEPTKSMTLEEVREISRWLMIANDGCPDPNSSQAVGTAIMLGLYAREKTGRGQAIYATMMQANAYANGDEAYEYAGRPAPSISDADCYGLNALYRLYEASEGGWLFLGIMFDEEWATFTETVGRADLAADLRFATAEVRRQHDDELASELSALFAGKTADQWETQLTAAGIAGVRADSDSGAFFEEDPQSVLNQLVVETESARVGHYKRHGGIVQFSEAPGRFGPAAYGGEHTVSLLKELGFAQEQIDALHEKRVVTWEEVNRVPNAI